jgi:hypothetical protein
LGAGLAAGVAAVNGEGVWLERVNWPTWGGDDAPEPSGVAVTAPALSAVPVAPAPGRIGDKTIIPAALNARTAAFKTPGRRIAPLLCYSLEPTIGTALPPVNHLLSLPRLRTAAHIGP